MVMIGVLASDGDDMDEGVGCSCCDGEEVSFVMSWFSFRKCCFSICLSVDTSKHSKSSLLYVIESTLDTYMDRYIWVIGQ